MSQLSHRPLIAVALALLLLTLAAPGAAAAPSPAMPSDFDGDGHADLAIGAPSERVGRADGAGAVSVLYGSAKAWRGPVASAGPRTRRGSRGEVRGAATPDSETASA